LSRRGIEVLAPVVTACDKVQETRGTNVQPPKSPIVKTSTARTQTPAKPPGPQPAPPKPPAAKPLAAKALPPAIASAAKAVTAKSLTEGQRAYETKRAAKAGMSLDKWLSSKEREREAEAKAKLKAAEAAKPKKPPGLFGRLLERAQRPLRS
jgi:hypothetical protein